MKYRRVLLKMSGESLGGPSGSGLDREALTARAMDLLEAIRSGVQIAVVPGGGNIFRGLQAGVSGLGRTTGDRLGMLATIMNALALAEVVQSLGIPAFVRSALPAGSFVRAFDQEEAKALLESGHVGIFPGGTGNPFFTTDTAAVLRALELDADVLLKGTRVDGVYTGDPEKLADAVLYKTVSFDEVLSRNLAFMDLTATALCKENDLPVIVFNQERKGGMQRVLLGEEEGTLVWHESELQG